MSRRVRNGKFGKLVHSLSCEKASWDLASSDSTTSHIIFLSTQDQRLVPLIESLTRYYSQSRTILLRHSDL